MGSMTLTYDATSMTAACMPAQARVERFGVSPIFASLPRSSAPFAGQPAAAHAAHTTKNVVDRKADGWVPPRGRTL